MRVLAFGEAGFGGGSALAFAGSTSGLRLDAKPGGGPGNLIGGGGLTFPGKIFAWSCEELATSPVGARGLNPLCVLN